jgi:hypothetical protein
MLCVQAVLFIMGERCISLRLSPQNLVVITFCAFFLSSIVMKIHMLTSNVNVTHEKNVSNKSYNMNQEQIFGQLIFKGRNFMVQFTG